MRSGTVISSAMVLVAMATDIYTGRSLCAAEKMGKAKPPASWRS